jgi:hypothetical protein
LQEQTNRRLERLERILAEEHPEKTGKATGKHVTDGLNGVFTHAWQEGRRR